MTAPGPSRPNERDADGSAKARSSSKVVLLAGGTGGAKLARGMLDVVGPDELVVIANTGDDIDIYGAHVSPDPDLVSFWLADLIDERGWGIEGDTFAVMDAMRALGTHDVEHAAGELRPAGAAGQHNDRSALVAHSQLSSGRPVMRTPA